MKNFAALYIAVCLALSSGGASAQAALAAPADFACTDKAAVHAAQQIIDAWKDGYNRRDPEHVAALYAEDAYYLTQHFATGIVHGREAIQAYVKVGTDAGYHIDSIRMLALGCSGETMYVLTRYDSTNGGQAAFGVNLVVLRKSGEQWNIVAHEAAVPDPATAIQRLEIPASTPSGR